MALRSLLGTLAFAAALFPYSAAGNAQGGTDNGGGLTVPVGRTSPVQIATLTFTTSTVAGSPFTINVLTQGAPGLDYNFVGGGTCSMTTTYAVGGTCTVFYKFSPKYPGARYGGISLTVGTTVLANTYINGKGLGPQVTFLPPTQIPLGISIPFGDDIAVDGNGNLFVPDFFGPLFEIPKGCTNQNCVVTMGGYNFTSVAVDGSGNVYTAAYLPSDSTVPLVAMFPRGCLSASCSVPVIGRDVELATPEGIAVDGSGDIYLSAGKAGTSDMLLVEFPSGCSSATCMVTLLDGIPTLGALAVDVSGNLYLAEANVVYQLPQGCRSANCLVVMGGGFNRPDGFALDGAGDLFISDGVTNALYEVPMGCSNASCTVTVASGSGFPFGIARDGSGNLYVNDDHNPDTIYELDVVDPPTVTFSTTAQGQVSPTQTVTVINNGNAPLAFAPSVSQANPSISRYFQLDSTSPGTCGALIYSSADPTLSPGQNCAMPLAFAPVAPALGTVTGTSVLVDDSLNVADTSQTIQLIGNAVLPGTTSTTLISSANPVYANVSTTLTAQVTSVSGTPTGTVTFSDGTTVLAIVPVSAATVSGTASASYAATFVAASTHTLTASFTPTGIFLSSSASLVEQVIADVAVATLTSSPNPALLNTPVGLSVSMSASPAGPVPTGTVTFTSNGAALGTVTLVNGVATYTTTSLTAGGDSLSCTYSGDTNFATASCNTVFETIDATPIAVRLSLASTVNPSSAFGPVSFTATLTNARVPIIGAQINFTIDGIGAGTVTTGANGTATLPLPNGLAPGAHTAIVISAPLSVYAGETASLIETVNLIPTTLTLYPPPSSAAYGASVTLTAMLMDSLTGAAETALDANGLLPRGSVTFYANGTALGTVSAINPGMRVTRTVSLMTTALPAGMDIITCSYSGDASFAASNCQSASIAVSVPSDFSISVTPSTQTVNPGDTANYSVTLAGINGPFTSPVTLTVSGLPNGATASFNQQVLTPGSGTATATLSVITSPTMALRQQHSGIGAITYGVFLLPFFGLFRGRRALRISDIRVQCVLALLLLIGFQVLTGCGGGNFGLPPISHTFTVSGTSGVVTHIATAALLVR